MGDFFLKKLCMAQQTFLGKFMGGMFYMGTNDQIIQGEESFTNAFSSNMNPVNLRIFLKVNGKEISKVDSSSFSLSLTQTWFINIYLKI